MSVTLYPGTPGTGTTIPTRRPLLSRLAADLAIFWHAWREGRAQQRRLLALQGLSEHTLRDIGMAQCTGLRPRSIAAADFLRGL